MVVQPGNRLPSRRVEVQAWPMKVMAALLDDPNRIHWDIDNVAVLGLGHRPVNQGPSNVAYIVDMLLDWVGGDPAALQRIAVRFHGNVFAGDVVETGGVVTDVTAASGAVCARLDVWLDRPDQRVVSGSAQVLVPA